MKWPNRDPIAEQGHRLLRGACVTCYSALMKDVNSYEFCDNSPVLEHDPFGLDCQDTYDQAMKAANQAGLKCLGHAVGEGIIGGILWGLGGAVVGGVGGSLLGPEGTVPGNGVRSCGRRSRKCLYRSASLAPVSAEGEPNETSGATGL